MKQFNLTLLLILVAVQVYPQTKNFAQTEIIKTKEVKLEFSNGFALFNICVTNPTIQINDNQKYNWYSESNGLQETNGSFSGNLLNGKFQFFNKDGKLIDEKYFKKGIKDGRSISWDDQGNILVILNWSNGKCDYEKESYSSPDYTIEWSFNKNYKADENLTNVPQLDDSDCICVTRPGCVKKSFIKNSLLKNEKLAQKVEWLNDFVIRTSWYYESNGKIESESYYFPEFSKTKQGTYKEFYPDGKLKVEGKVIHDDIKHGEFKYYKNDGTLEKTETYDNNELIDKK